MENQPKIDPKSIKKRTKIDQKSTRSEKCRALRLGGVLGESKGPTQLQVGVPNRRKIDRKSMQKSIKNSMPSKFQFSSNFDRFLEGKWRHVGTKIESKIDVNFERPILQKVLKNQQDFNVFLSFWGRSQHQKSIKNQSKIEAQDGSPLGIDFWWILVGFGTQVGRENRAKSEQKAIKQRIKFFEK